MNKPHKPWETNLVFCKLWKRPYFSSFTILLFAGAEDEQFEEEKELIMEEIGRVALE